LIEYFSGQNCQKFCRCKEKGKIDSLPDKSRLPVSQTPCFSGF